MITCQHSNISTTLYVAQTVKCLPTMRETGVRSLGQEQPLEKEMATYSSTVAWKILWMGDPGRLQSMGSKRVRHDWATSLSLYMYVQSLSRVWLFATPWTVACQASLSMEFSRQEYWSGLSFISPSNYCICFLSPTPLSLHSWINTSLLPLPSSRLFEMTSAFCLPGPCCQLFPVLIWISGSWMVCIFLCIVLGAHQFLRSWKSKMSVFYPPTWLVAWIYNSRFRNISFQIVK